LRGGVHWVRRTSKPADLSASGGLTPTCLPQAGIAEKDHFWMETS